MRGSMRTGARQRRTGVRLVPAHGEHILSEHTPSSTNLSHGTCAFRDMDAASCTCTAAINSPKQASLTACVAISTTDELSGKWSGTTRLGSGTTVWSADRRLARAKLQCNSHYDIEFYIYGIMYHNSIIHCWEILIPWSIHLSPWLSRRFRFIQRQPLDIKNAKLPHRSRKRPKLHFSAGNPTSIYICITSGMYARAPELSMPDFFHCRL